MIWMHYGYHEYMDEKPGDGYRLFESVEQSKDWADHMRKNYTGGTTWIIGPATQSEILDYIKKNDITPDELTMNNINNTSYYQTI